MLLPKRLEVATIPGGKTNSDAYNIAFNSTWCLWVIDGATALVPSGENELQVFVRRVNEEIGKVILDHAPLYEAMAVAARTVSADFSDFPRQPYERPSCSVALARVGSGKLEYFVLGDAVVVADTADGVQVFSNREKIARLDRIAIEEKLRLQIKHGMSSRDAWAAIQPTLRRHRALMNTPEGYWIFNGDPEACFNATFGSIDMPQGRRILVATDGFTRLVDMGVFPDWKSLFFGLGVSSLWNLLYLLRDVENQDPECLIYPRFRIHDDATAIYVEF